MAIPAQDHHATSWKRLLWRCGTREARQMFDLVKDGDKALAETRRSLQNRERTERVDRSPARQQKSDPVCKRPVRVAHPQRILATAQGFACCRSPPARRPRAAADGPTAAAPLPHEMRTGDRAPIDESKLHDGGCTLLIWNGCLAISPCASSRSKLALGLFRP